MIGIFKSHDMMKLSCGFAASPVAPVVTVVEALNSTALMVSWNYTGVVDNLLSFVIETKEVCPTTLFNEQVETDCPT